MPKPRVLTIHDTESMCDGEWVSIHVHERDQFEIRKLKDQIAELQDDLRESIERRQELERELSELTPCPGPESE